jgi:hypothetical protein
MLLKRRFLPDKMKILLSRLGSAQSHLKKRKESNQAPQKYERNQNRTYQKGKVMIYREISGLLLRLSLLVGGPVRSVESPDAGTTALFVNPVGWFLAVEDTGELDIGRRKGEDLRLTETQRIPFTKVTEGCIRRELDLTLLELAGHSIAESVPESPILRVGLTRSQTLPNHHSR